MKFNKSVKPAKLAKEKDCYVRNGQTLYFPDGKQMKCKSINLAKKESRKLQTDGLGRGQVIAFN